MSYQVGLFRAQLAQPQVNSNFLVYIDGFELSVLRAEATSLPFPEYDVQQTHYRGMHYTHPTKRNVTHTWSCSFYEDILGVTTFATLRQLILKQFHGGSVFTKFSVIICPTIGHSIIPVPHSTFQLKGSWIKSISPLTFNAADAGNASKLNITFSFDDIENITFKAFGSDPFALKHESEY